YITKPFSINEVIARVKSLMRRFLILGSDGESLEKTSIKYKDLTIDLKKYIIVIGGEEVPLTAKEFELLKFLAAHNEQVFTKTQLFRNVWESDYIEDDNTVMVHIRKLRKKIEVDPSNTQFIQTVWGIGYSLLMNKMNDKIIFLIMLQFITITGILMIDIYYQTPAIVRWFLFIVLFFITAILLFKRIHYHTQLKRMNVELERAINGNLNTRLLANHDKFFNELTFSINDLIEQLEKV